ncbi:MAG: META domain-containing protein [Flavobacteriaceae bacterium]
MKTSKILIVLISLIGLQSCTSVKKSEVMKETFWVSGTKTQCDAGAGKMMCLNISKAESLNNAIWQNFYSHIEGFTFKENVYQHIEVTVEKLDKKDIPADASSLKYTLTKVLATQKDETVLLNGDWVLTRLNNGPLNRMVTVPTMKIDLSEKRISGNAGCNNYSVSINDVSLKSLDLGIAAMTKKMCVNKTIEAQYGKALAAIKTYRLTESGLVFYNQSGEEILSYIKNDVAETNINIHDIWVAVSIEGHPINRMVKAPRLEINLTKMKVMGNDGCNNFSGDIKNIDANKLELGAIAGTQKACRNMEIANQFNNALTASVSYKIENNRLVFSDSNDNETLKLIKTD